eukprot:13725088-Ditylum_brightwellii.AAC.1
MGTKSQNYENVINRLMNEIRQLKDIKEHYWGLEKKIFSTDVEVLTYAADRPERDSHTKVLGHGNNNTKCWRQSCYLNQNDFVSCKCCHKNA